MIRIAVRKLLFYLPATSLLLTGILVVLVLNPGLAYAHKTVIGNYTVYHNTALEPFFNNGSAGLPSLSGPVSCMTPRPG